jgi:hypothetical protein
MLRLPEGLHARPSQGVRGDMVTGCDLAVGTIELLLARECSWLTRLAGHSRRLLDVNANSALKYSDTSCAAFRNECGHMKNRFRHQ